MASNHSGFLITKGPVARKGISDMTKGTVNRDGCHSTAQALNPIGEGQLDGDLVAHRSFPLEALSFEGLHTECSNYMGTRTTASGRLSRPRPQSEEDAGRNKRIKRSNDDGVPGSFLLNSLSLPVAGPDTSQYSTTAAPSTAAQPGEIATKPSPAGSSTAPNEDAGNPSGTAFQSWPFKPLGYVSYRPISVPISVGVCKSQ